MRFEVMRGRAGFLCLAAMAVLVTALATRAEDKDSKPSKEKDVKKVAKPDAEKPKAEKPKAEKPKAEKEADAAKARELSLRKARASAWALTFYLARADDGGGHPKYLVKSSIASM